MSSRLAVIDFETTGLSPDNGDRITEVAIVIIESEKVVDQFESLVNTGRFIPTCHALTFVEMAKLECHMNSISPNLIRAYRKSKFVVEYTSTITLLIGRSNSSLGALLKEYKISTAAFITAFNPHSNVLSDQDNIDAQNSLIKDIKALGLHTIKGFGQDVDEQWPREDSVLILGITESQAETLADRYSQNGFIWIGSIDAFPALRLRYQIALPTNIELTDWLSKLPVNLSGKAKQLSPLDQAWIMSVPYSEQTHWLDSDSWDYNKVWPLAKPDGSAMGVGTELDRVFKLIAAGQSQIIRN